MNIIITMAGEGSRFKDIGFTEPKHEIIARGKTLFEWSLESLQGFPNAHYIFIARAEHNSISFINKHIPSHILSFEVLEIDFLTKGQAETAYLSKPLIKNLSDSFMIFNIDTFVEPDSIGVSMIKGSGWVPTFFAKGDKWSFASFDQSLRVLDVTEKIRISDYGTVGLYYFESFNLYERTFKENNWGTYKEQYVAPLYQHIVKTLNLPVYTSIVSAEKVHVLGTPEDIVMFDSGFRSCDNLHLAD